MTTNVDVTRSDDPHKPWQDYCESEVPLKAVIQKFLSRN